MVSKMYAFAHINIKHLLIIVPDQMTSFHPSPLDSDTFVTSSSHLEESSTTGKSGKNTSETPENINNGGNENITETDERRCQKRAAEKELEKDGCVPASPLGRVDPNTPDRPGRPSVPTPGKYGTGYGGAPSPGPAPTGAFPPPPPAAPRTAGGMRRTCLQKVLGEASVTAAEEDSDENKP